MKIYDNGIIREMTKEEEQAMLDEQARYEVEERKRELTDKEVMNMFLTQNIQQLEVNDTTALRMKSRYPKWEKHIEQWSQGRPLPVGFKLTYKGDLWEVSQSHTPVAVNVPSINTASIYRRIDEKHLGNKYDPIPYVPPMVLERGKFYLDKDVVYECIEDSIVVMTHNLKDLPRYAKAI